MKTPVLFLLFNRPEQTFRVFEEIRKAQPEKLFIAADGPREDKEGEAGNCEQARSIVNKIDWKCEVKTLFRDKNLGCRDAVSSAITWFFDNVEEGIILEDDCLPNQSFFKFCEELLERYRDNKTIMHIGGVNLQNGKKRGRASYYFSAYPHIWGWATWRRSWQLYNINFYNDKSKAIIKNVNNVFHDIEQANFWNTLYSKTISHEIDTWDFQWQYTVWRHRGLAILPQSNLVSNIGFGENATHTTELSHSLSNLPLEEYNTFTNTNDYFRDTEADKFVYNTYYKNHKNKVPFKIIMKDKMKQLTLKIINLLKFKNLK